MCSLLIPNLFNNDSLLLNILAKQYSTSPNRNILIAIQFDYCHSRAQKKLFLDSMVNRGSTAKAMALDEEHGRGDASKCVE